MKTYYYNKFTDDVVSTHYQDYQLADNYSIFPTNLAGKIWNPIIRTIAVGLGWGYRKIAKVQVIGQEKMRGFSDQGYFIYGNHTQPFGDVVTPLTLASPYHYYALADQANWGVPVLGKLLVRYGGLPVGRNLRQSAQLIGAIKDVITKQKGIIMIYPEAHVWPYYSKIRPFSSTSFHFPVALQTPIFVMTTTYQRPRFGHRPRIIIYVDGPLWPDYSVPKKVAQEKLCQQVRTLMVSHTQNNNYQYYQYIPIKKVENSD